VSDPGQSRRSWSSRHRRARPMFLRVATLVLIFVGVCVGAWRLFSARSSPDNTAQADLKWAQGNLSQNLARLATASVSSPLSLPRRVVYPYSVIPGGIQTAEELRELSQHDRIVGSHYAGFDFRNARIVELDQPKLVYLSYRMNGRVFWTAKRISLRKGEKLITDGKMTARTRCANRVSEKPQPEISPAEPPAAKFEQPFVGTAGQIPFPGDLVATGQGREFSPLSPPGLRTSIAPFPGGGLPPIFPPPIPSKSCLPTGNAGIKEEAAAGSGKNNPCRPHKPPPPAVPEPTTMLLVSSGLAGIYWRRRKAAARQ
jgi:hypothetical protein